MAQGTCVTRGCSRPTIARGLCKGCYNRMYQSGAFQYAIPLGAAHRITDVDREARTAVCSECGPTKVRIRSDRKTAQCWTVRKGEIERSRAKGNGAGQVSRAELRRRRLYHKYRLQLSAWEAMLIEQDGRCAICLCPMESPHVDHDHSTGMVRGLLCKWCNLAIGYMKDDGARLRAAADYLAP